MLSIKDYLSLQDIRMYLQEQLSDEITENNGYSNLPVERLNKLNADINRIISKLENEEE